MPFGNPIVGGTTLVRPAIKSPNFVTGSLGWQIAKDGSAEFNNIVIRGGTVSQGQTFVYDGTPALGNLILSISPTAGTDAYGNSYPTGLALYGANGDITLYDASGSPRILADGIAGITVQNATAAKKVRLDPAGGLFLGDTVNWTQEAQLALSSSAGLSITGPSNSSGIHDDPAVLALFPGDGSTTPAKVRILSPVFRTDLELSGDIISPGLQAGRASTPAPGVGGGTSTIAVSFPQTCNTTPRITITPVTTVDPNPTGGVSIVGYVDSVTTSGFTIRAYRSSNSATNWDWQAISNS